MANGAGWGAALLALQERSGRAALEAGGWRGTVGSLADRAAAKAPAARHWASRLQALSAQAGSSGSEADSDADREGSPEGLAGGPGSEAHGVAAAGVAAAAAGGATAREQEQQPGPEGPSDLAVASQRHRLTLHELYRAVKDLSQAGFLGRAVCAASALLAHTTERRGKSLVDQSCSGLVTRLFEQPSRSSDTAVAIELSMDRRRVPRIAFRTASALWQSQVFSIGRAMESVVSVMKGRGASCVAFFESVRYDETPLRLRVSTARPERPGAKASCNQLPAAGTAQPQVQKLLQREMSYHLVFSMGGKSVMFSMGLACPLQILERCTGHGYLAAHRKLDLDFVKTISGEFAAKHRLVTTDADGAVGASERGVLHGRPGWAALHTKCFLHKVARLRRNICEIVDPDISGSIHLARSLILGGSMAALRTALRRLVQERLVILRGRPGPTADEHRRALISTFLVGSTPTDRMRAIVIAFVANGDWRKKGVLEHYCSSGCCEDESTTVERATGAFVWALSGVAPRIFNRARWTHAEQSVDSSGRFLVAHGILADAFCFWVSGGRRQASGSGSASATGPHRDDGEKAGAEAATAPEDMGDGKDSGAMELVGCAAKPPGESHDGEANWQETNRMHRNLATKFLDSEPLGRWCVLRKVVGLHSQLTYAYLHRAGDEYDTTQEAKSAGVGVDSPSGRSFRMREALEMKAEGQFTKECLRLMADSSEWDGVPMSARTVGLEALAFRMLSGSLALCQSSLVHLRKVYPWRLFAALDNTDLKVAVLADPPCLRDEWSAAFIERHPSLDGPGVQAEHGALLQLFRECTASIEAKHASIRRQVVRSSCQTHVEAAQKCSSMFVLQEHRRLQPPVQVGPELVEPSADSVDEGVPPPLKKHRGAGGPWHAFIHHVGRGRKCDFKALSAEYNALPPERKAFFEELGRQGTDASRHGGRAFGPSSREVQRFAIAERRRVQSQSGGMQPALGSGTDGPLALASSGVRGTGAPIDAIVASEGHWDRVRRAKEDAIVASSGARERRSEEQDAVARYYSSASSRSTVSGIFGGIGDAIACQADFVAPPEVGDFIHLKWNPRGARELAESALALEPRSGAGGKLHSALQLAWEQAHHPISPAEDASIPPPPRASRCAELGVCVCTSPGKERLRVLQRLDGAAKLLLSGRSSKDLACRGLLVFRLTGSLPPDGSAIDVHWLHLAFQSLSPWRSTFLKMHSLPEQCEGGAIRLGSMGEVASSFEACSCLDQALEWRLRVFKISAPDRPVGVLRPHRVEIAPLDVGLQGGQVEFWPPPKPTRRARQKKSASCRQQALAIGDNLEGAEFDPDELDILGALEQAVVGAGVEEASDAQPDDCSDMASDDEEELVCRMAGEMQDFIEPDGQVDAPSAERPLHVGGGADPSDEAGARDAQEVLGDGGLGDGNQVAPARPRSSSSSSASSSTSSSSTSSSSSSASSSVGVVVPEVADVAIAPIQPPHPDPEQVLAAVRGNADITLRIEGTGLVRYYAWSGRLEAKCSATGCRKTRGIRAGKGSGRPVAYLVAWLLAAGQRQFDGRQARLNFAPTFEERLRVRREVLPNLENGPALMAQERPPREGEGDEPEDVS